MPVDSPSQSEAKKSSPALPSSALRSVSDRLGHIRLFVSFDPGQLPIKLESIEYKKNLIKRARPVTADTEEQVNNLLKTKCIKKDAASGKEQ